jgi:hypothetical protein
VLTLTFWFGSEKVDAGTPKFDWVGFNFPAGSRDISAKPEKP